MLKLKKTKQRGTTEQSPTATTKTPGTTTTLDTNKIKSGSNTGSDKGSSNNGGSNGATEATRQELPLNEQTPVTSDNGKPDPQWKGWTDDDLEHRIKLFEAKGWDDRTFDNTQEYLSLVNEALRRDPNNPDKQARADINKNSYLQHNKLFYNHGYQDIIDSSKLRSKAEDALSKSEGRNKPIMGILPEFLTKEYGNPWWATSKKNSRYKVLKNGKEFGPYVGEPLSKKQIKRLNDAEKEALKRQGYYIWKDPDGKYLVLDKHNVIQGEFKNEKAAEKWFDQISAGDESGSTYTVTDTDGSKWAANSEREAKNLRKTFNDLSAPERKKAWGQFLYRMLDSITTNNLNYVSNVAGQGMPYKSVHQKDIEDRLSKNNEMYYKNEGDKNSNIRKLMAMADAGMIDLNNLTNEQIAMMSGLYGQETIKQLVSTLGKQKLAKQAAQDLASWPSDLRDIYLGWRGLEGAPVADKQLMALLAGETSSKELGNIWRTETKLELSKMGINVQQLEQAVEQARINNKMSRAQADVVKELVAEQLKAAQLSNAKITQSMVTESANAIANIISQFIP